MFGQSFALLIGAVCGGIALPILWWSVAADKSDDGGVRNRLHVDNVDLRSIVLDRGGNERLIKPGLASASRFARSISPVGMVERLDRKIVLAGMGNRWPLERVLGMKFLLGAGFGLLLLLRLVSDPTSMRMIFISVMLVVGVFLMPDLLIGIRGHKRQEEIGRSLPDILDQITISVEAGLGFDSAIGHVATTVDSPLSEELARTLQDVKVGMTRSQAFDNLSKRTDVQELRQFIVSLQQAEKLGVPIAQVLRIQSSELRTIRRQKAEENAQKVPVKMILPLVMLILPALIIIVLAPAVFGAMDAFQ